ncbi:hypothetical protein EYF80_065355 [Liparis tanakae]|uniref:Uncharacterized protein n=1 Tax=Liparis tanakae TaxID=230148 RepID=A0A4Z2E6X9_9TELE|nr:hypothetical protein EYF80_065355 [Liparis tanakae]
MRGAVSTPEEQEAAQTPDPRRRRATRWFEKSSEENNTPFARGVSSERSGATPSSSWPRPLLRLVAQRNFLQVRAGS